MKEYGKTAIVLKWLLGIGIVGYLISSLDISAIQRAVFQAELKYVALGLLVIITLRVFSAWQTKMVLEHHHVLLTTPRALAINTIAGFYSLFFPGDLITGALRWYKFSKPSGKRAEVFAGIFFLKLINTTFILIFGIIGILKDDHFGSTALNFAALVSLALLAAVYLCIFSESISSRLGKFIETHSRRRSHVIGEKVQKMWSSIAQNRTLPWKTLLEMLSVSLINILLSILLYFLIAQALHLRIPVFALIWIRSLVFLIQLIPISISGLGFREGALVLILPYYGAAQASAMAFSLIIFGYILLIGLIGGILEAREVLVDLPP
jgi:uncharacterized membrane protein YbhN (UPF0104 family)